MQYIIDMLETLGGPAAIIGAIISWLGVISSKRILQKEKVKLDKDLEKHKGTIQQEIEHSKISLASQAKLLEERFNAINQETMRALIENYEMLADAWLACRWAIQPDEIGRDKPDAKTRLQHAANVIDEYFKNFEKRRIFLNKNTQDAIYSFINSIWLSLRELRIFADSNEHYDEKLQKLYENWIHDLKPKMDKARECIEREYKDIIGLELHNK